MHFPSVMFVYVSIKDIYYSINLRDTRFEKKKKLFQDYIIKVSHKVNGEIIGF